MVGDFMKMTELGNGLAYLEIDGLAYLKIDMALPIDAVLAILDLLKPEISEEKYQELLAIVRQRVS